MTDKSKRKHLKWIAPVVAGVALPAHAITSEPLPPKKPNPCKKIEREITRLEIEIEHLQEEFLICVEGGPKLKGGGNPCQEYLDEIDVRKERISELKQELKECQAVYVN